MHPFGGMPLVLFNMMVCTAAASLSLPLLVVMGAVLLLYQGPKTELLHCIPLHRVENSILNGRKEDTWSLHECLIKQCAHVKNVHVDVENSNVSNLRTPYN